MTSRSSPKMCSALTATECSSVIITLPDLQVSVRFVLLSPPLANQALSSKKTQTQTRETKNTQHTRLDTHNTPQLRKARSQRACPNIDLGISVALQRYLKPANLCMCACARTHAHSNTHTLSHRNKHTQTHTQAQAQAQTQRHRHTDTSFI